MRTNLELNNKSSKGFIFIPQGRSEKREEMASLFTEKQSHLLPLSSLTVTVRVLTIRARVLHCSSLTCLTPGCSSGQPFNNFNNADNIVKNLKIIWDYHLVS